VEMVKKAKQKVKPKVRSKENKIIYRA